MNAKTELKDHLSGEAEDGRLREHLDDDGQPDRGEGLTAEEVGFPAGVLEVPEEHEARGDDGGFLVASVREVALHPGVELASLAEILDGYGDLGQQRWAAWWRKQQPPESKPEPFGRGRLPPSTSNRYARCGAAASMRLASMVEPTRAPSRVIPSRVRARVGR